MTFDEAANAVVMGFEALGVAVLVAGSIASAVTYFRDIRRIDRTHAFKLLRGNVGRTILLGLEILIVADIVLTVAVDRTLESAVTLGLIVLIRTFLSFSLEIELDGVAPWRRRALEADASTPSDPLL